ncbi:hypothetical protein [Bacillus horti]|uniref:DUF3139 domain-containing protein n=1 Tax=Caldalkalibacillus horti TaxID=77523 RepID=A0ABT9VYD5_9BACI|nr:hypothetical protein [Bacillus horti]
MGYMLTGAVALVIVAFFVFRPYWIDYQIIEKMTMLEDYLEDRYPKEKWDITAIDHRTYRQYNPYHLIVAFESEPGWQYAYYVSSEGNVKQVWHSVDSEHENLNGDGKFLE